MASKYSSGAIVSSIFKKFVNEQLTPEFIRDEANRLCDALGIDHVGDPGKVTRDFRSSQAVQKNADKAEYYWFNPENCQDEIFLRYDNLYNDSSFNPQKYEALKYIDSLRSSMLNNPTDNVDSVLEKLGLKNTDEFHDAANTPHSDNRRPPLDPPTQIIYYGVPGCGKSHQVNKKIKSLPDYNKIRTVFHPEYTNADFIGQILPEVCVDGNGRSVVEYKFNPGPFTEIVRRAYLNPDEEFFLVIEEINRGNAAAIFGDMFQLLDRLDADEKPVEVSSEHVYGKGWSSYGVDNPDINAYIRNQLVISSEKPEHCSKVNGSGEDANPKLYKSVDIESENVSVTWREKTETGFTPKAKHLHFSANTAVRLPPNLSIYATMNTSDQNVFTLDNAFQRRWEMKQVPNDLKDKIPANASEEEKKNIQAEIDQYNEIIGNTNVKWGDFRKVVNEVIMDSAQANGLSSMEDKRLGGWFFTPPDNFAEKVLKYLWDDAFKFDRKTQFGEIKTLEELVKNFNKDGFKVFKADAIAKLQKDSSTTPDGADQNDTPVVDG